MERRRRATDQDNVVTERFGWYGAGKDISRRNNAKLSRRADIRQKHFPGRIKRPINLPRPGRKRHLFAKSVKIISTRRFYRKRQAPHDTVGVRRDAGMPECRCRVGDRGNGSRGRSHRAPVGKISDIDRQNNIARIADRAGERLVGALISGRRKIHIQPDDLGCA